MTPRNSELTRRAAAILRTFSGFVVSPAWIPHSIISSAAYEAGIFASEWPALAGTVFTANATLWTLINRGNSNYTGPVASISCSTSDNTQYYDVYQGVQVYIVTTNGSCYLPAAIEAAGIGALLQVNTADVTPALLTFLSTMHTMTQAALASYSNTLLVLSQSMVPIEPTTPLSSAPLNMSVVPAITGYQFVVNGIEIEGSNLPGVDFQYPQETVGYGIRNHNITLDIHAFYMDTFPVTNAAYYAFLQASQYWPMDSHNFLYYWNCTSVSSCQYTRGWDDKPVTYVSLTDARAYCNYYGKRLPNEWEWQYAAQGADGRWYPWGNTSDSSRVPAFQNGGVLLPPMDVGSYPNGTSPFGIYDMNGLIWQWTNEFVTAHTRDAPIRGGSYYRPACSQWYFPQAMQLNQHGNWLLMSDSMDRRGTLGFRCVVDAE
jgi:iron(II)-dependent oxidoreductase